MGFPALLQPFPISSLIVTIPFSLPPPKKPNFQAAKLRFFP